MHEEDRSAENRIGNRWISAGLVAILVAVVAIIGYVERPWADSGQASVPEGDIDELPLGMLENRSPEPGNQAPDFVLETADGSRVRLSDLQGRPVFLNFWADWCTFCKEEMPDMQRVSEEYGDNLVVIGVNAGDPVEVGEAFAEQVGVTYTRLYDLDLDVTQGGYNVQAMPTSYFIDADGKIVNAHFGFMTYEQMIENVEQLDVSRASSS